MASKSQPLSLDAFLLPLQIDIPTIHGLARSLCSTFNTLAAQSKDQFLPTPISEELLRPRRDEDGRYELFLLDSYYSIFLQPGTRSWLLPLSYERWDGQNSYLDSITDSF